MHHPGCDKSTQGNNVDHEQRFSGEFELEVLLEKVLKHGDVALTFKEAFVDDSQRRV